MTNLIKMDLYRLLRSKAFRVGIISAVIIAFGSLLLNLGLLEIIKYGMQSDPDTSLEGVSALIPSVAWLTGTDFANIVLHCTGTLSLLVACIVSASFVSAEQSCGYVKNIAGQLKNRGVTVVSKFAVTSLFHLIVLAIYTIICCIFVPIFFSQYIETYTVGSMFIVLGLRILLYWAINAIIVFLCTLTKSQSLAMVVGAIFGIGVTKLAYMGINSIFTMTKLNFDISAIMPDGILGNLGLYTIDTLALKAILVSIVFTVIFIVCAMHIIKKRDVR